MSFGCIPERLEKGRTGLLWRDGVLGVPIKGQGQANSIFALVSADSVEDIHRVVDYQQGGREGKE